MSDPGKAVFLSYASQDAEAAKRICETLRVAGVEVWFDTAGGLEHGDEWDAKIRRQIKECVLFIPIISANTQAREEGYFRLEWDLAAERARTIASGVAFILPVLIDETKEVEALVPDRFRTVQWTRLRDGEVSPEVRQRFLHLWSHRAGLLKHEAVEAGRPRPAIERGEGTPPPRRSRFRWLVALAVVMLAAGVTVAWQMRRHAEQQRKREAAKAEVVRLAAAQDVVAAFVLAREARRESPGDPVLEKAWAELAVTTTFESTPAGADLYVRDYVKPEAPWLHLGQTPLTAIAAPKTFVRLKIEKPGFVTVEKAWSPSAKRQVTLDPIDAIPPGMVRCSGGRMDQNFSGLPTAQVGAFLIDAFEVTNREFKEFVDRGGYEKPEYWKQTFVRGGRTLSREEAMAEFRDATGRPGPATWRDGTYRAGEEDLPVTGLSWFEAAAYAEFAGKRLPSVYHWQSAAAVGWGASLPSLSNYAGRGLARRGAYQGMSSFGAYDLAGNAREWCWNAAGPDTRYILGGAWREPDYMFTMKDAASAFDRSELNGFRCVKLPDGQGLAPAIDAVIPSLGRDYTAEQPVSDEVFGVIRGLYTYAATPLEVRLEESDDTDPRWRKETVSYRAAYGDERIPAYVFLPKNAAPPYQAIVYFPGIGSLYSKSSNELFDMNPVAVLAASGRAVIYPVYKGTYERQVTAALSNLHEPNSPILRDLWIQMGKDFSRTMDYLETRPDVQADKIAFMGLSFGAGMGVILPVLDSRIKASALMIGGFFPGRFAPEVDQLNFASRNTVPTLMLNGRSDFVFPYATTQRPLFQLLGAAPEHKKHVLFETGHSLTAQQIASEAYVWLDRYLGPVK